MTDSELLQRYASTRDQQAFAELVGRHVDWAYSTALRQVGNTHLAEDVTQAVFLALAEQASKLARGAVLGAWLFQVTRFASAKALRSESRRQRHEKKASAMRPEHQTSSDDQHWRQIAPVLDQAVGSLRVSDRLAVVLRFYQGKSWQEVGEALSVSEDAARVRVSRALERLRVRLESADLTLGSTSVLATDLLTHATHAAPAGLTTVIVTSATAPATASAAAISLWKGATTMMTLAKIKVAALAISLTLLAGSGGVFVVSTVIAQQSAQDQIGVQRDAAQKAPATRPVDREALFKWATERWGEGNTDEMKFQGCTARLFVADVEASLDFYHKLGFNLTGYRNPEADWKIQEAGMSAGDARLQLRPWPPGQAKPSTRGAVTLLVYVHGNTKTLGMKDNLRALSALRAAIATRGVKVGELQDNGPNTVEFFVEDPDGNIVGCYTSRA